MRPMLRAIAQTLLDSLDAPPQSRRTNILVGDELLRAIALNKFVTQLQGTVTIDVPPNSHTHVKADVTDFPATMPPDAHTHVTADVTDFPASLPGRMAVVSWVGNGAASRIISVNTDFLPRYGLSEVVGQRMVNLCADGVSWSNISQAAITIDGTINTNGYTFRMFILE
jgi:hypothetical protein